MDWPEQNRNFTYKHLFTMRKICFWIGSIFLLASAVQAQTLKSIRKQMILIPGSTFIMGGGYQYRIDGFTMKYVGEDDWYEKANTGGVAMGEIPGSNNPERQVTVPSFYLSSAEVTNNEYKNFLIDSLLTPAEQARHWKKMAPKKNEEDSVRFYLDFLFAKARKANLMPDTACWTRDFPFAFNKPLAEHYFWHVAFNEYPVVGVSWHQAKAYCAWLSRANNEDLRAQGKEPQPNFRLPTEAEWEYAARAIMAPEDHSHGFPRALYPWQGRRVWDDKGQYLANIKADHSDYSDDGYEYTAPVRSYSPNAFGLYNMAGNVSEWVEDVFRLVTDESLKTLDGGMRLGTDEPGRVIKGGSWADYRYAAQCGSRAELPAGQGYSRVGFRVAQIKP